MNLSNSGSRFGFDDALSAIALAIIAPVVKIIFTIHILRSYVVDVDA